MEKFLSRLVATLALNTLLSAGAPASEPASFLPPVPTSVIGNVVEFKHGASIVDFDHGSATFDHVVVQLIQPNEAKGAEVSLLYQGRPVAAGKPIEIGDRVSFTMPASDGSRGYPWGIYLSQLLDLRVLPDGI